MIIGLFRNLLRDGEFRFMPVKSNVSIDTLLCEPDIRSMTSIPAHLISTPSPATDLSVPDGLPLNLTSPICHFLFRLVEASVWHGYFFLVGWCPSPTNYTGGFSHFVPNLPPTCMSDLSFI